VTETYSTSGAEIQASSLPSIILKGILTGVLAVWEASITAPLTNKERVLKIGSVKRLNPKAEFFWFKILTAGAYPYCLIYHLSELSLFF